MVEEWVRIEVLLKKVDAEYLAEVCKTFGISPNDYIAYLIRKELYGPRQRVKDQPLKGLACGDGSNANRD